MNHNLSKNQNNDESKPTNNTKNHNTRNTRNTRNNNKMKNVNTRKNEIKNINNSTVNSNSNKNTVTAKYKNRRVRSNTLKHKYGRVQNTKRRFKSYVNSKKGVYTPNPILRNATYKNFRTTYSKNYLEKSRDKFEELEKDFIKIYKQITDKMALESMNIQENIKNTSENHKSKQGFISSVFKKEAKSTFGKVASLVSLRNPETKIEFSIYQFKKYVHLLKKSGSTDTFKEINELYQSFKNISALMHKTLENMVKYFRELKHQNNSSNQSKSFISGTSEDTKKLIKQYQSI